MKPLHDSLNSLNLPQLAQKNIRTGLSRVLEYGIEPISIIVFGSSLRDDFNEKTSDVDWILVVDDDVSDRNIAQCTDLLKRENPRRSDLGEGILGQILRVVGQQTGMFVSGFIARKSDVTNLSFERIFQVSSYTARIFAPSMLVLGSILDTARTVYGIDLLSSIRHTKPNTTQLFRSIAMNFIISFCALIISPFTRNAVRFTAESIKWSIYSRHYYLYNKSDTLMASIEHLRLRKRFPRFIGRFLNARQSFRPDPVFSAVSPLYVIRIHFAQ